MEIPVRLMVVGAIGCAVAGALLERQFNKNEVIKTVTVDHEVIKYQVVTVTHEADKPDGTKIIDTTMTDNSEKTTDVVQKIVDAKASQQFGYLAAVGMAVDANGVKTYSLSVDKRLLGPVTLGVFGSTCSELGLRIGVMF